MTYDGIVRDLKINYKTGTIIAEIKFPAQGLINEAKKRKKGMQSGIPLKVLIEMGFKDAIKETNINLTFSRKKKK